MLKPIRFFHPDDPPNWTAEQTKQDMLKWHKASLISLIEVKDG